MSSLAMNLLQPPSDPREYEKMVRDYCIDTFGGYVYLFGRQGQSQNGVDVIFSRKKNIVGVQCKKYNNTRITTNTIDEIIEEAESFSPTLSLLVIAIAQETDAKIQKYVLNTSQKRINEGKFKVEVLYWDEVENYLKNNSVLLNKYYPFLKNGTDVSDKLKVLVTDADDLRLKFLDIYCEHKIRKLILADVFIGIPFDLIISYDSFVIEVYELRNNACILQEYKIIQNIDKFIIELDKYVKYLGTLVTINEYNICVVDNLFIKNDKEKYDRKINKQRKKVVEKFLIASELKKF